MTELFRQYSLTARITIGLFFSLIVFGALPASGMIDPGSADFFDVSEDDEDEDDEDDLDRYMHEVHGIYIDTSGLVQEVVVTGTNSGGCNANRSCYELDPHSWKQTTDNLNAHGMDVPSVSPVVIKSRPVPTKQTEKEECESNGGQWVSFPVLADPRSRMPKILSACKPAITPAVCNSVATISGASFAASKSGKAVGRACTSHPLAGGICGAATVTIGLWCNDVTLEDIF